LVARTFAILPPGLRRGWSWGAAAEAASRAGYVARGFVYVSIGLVAVLAALGRTPQAEGAQGALFEAWADWPAGAVLIWLTGLGLYGFAGWRVLQSVFDADRQGREPKALVARAGQALSGLVYGGLAVSTFGLLDALEDLREPDDQAATRAFVGQALDWPFGGWAVMAAGGFIFALGAGNILQALTRDFCRQLVCDRGIGRWAQAFGRAGYLARGIAFLPAGVLMVSAGFGGAGVEAGGVGAALEVLGGMPHGGLILGLVGAGLIAFGLFAFVEARYRVIRAAEVVEG
jgi:hypothetical protein